MAKRPNKQEAARQAAAATQGQGEGKWIPLADLHPRPTNARKVFEEKAMGELTESIRKRGVLEPLLVRPRPEGGYEVVAGERRRRCSGEAGLTGVPCWVREMTDDEAELAGAVENLQRCPLNPIEEAREFKRLLPLAGSARKLAKELGKGTDPRYIAARLPLADVIDEVAEDLLAGHITLRHALSIARVGKEVQMEALKACYAYGWQNGEHVSVRGELDTSPEELDEWIEKNLHLDLSRAKFPLDDKGLREDKLTCLKCPERTGNDPLLFVDLPKEQDRCTNPKCFFDKTTKFIRLEAHRIAPTGSTEPAPIISPHNYDTPEGMLSWGQYVALSEDEEKCQTAELAVYGEGGRLGDTQLICRNLECPKHARKVHSNASNGSEVNGNRANTARAVPTALEKADRLQKRLNIKVNELSRIEVFRQAIKTYTHPQPREDRNEFAYKLYWLLRGDEQDTVERVLGQRPITEEIIEAMSEEDLAGFMKLCTYAGRGANPHGDHEVSQAGVIELANERGINYRLIDARMRVEKSTKGHMEAHKLHLRRVEEGKDVEPPNVYGGSPIFLLRKPPGEKEEDTGNLDGEENEQAVEGEYNEGDDPDYRIEDLTYEDWKEGESAENPNN